MAERRRPRPRVVVDRSADPMDVDGWAERYVRALLEAVREDPQEDVVAPVPAPAVRLGQQ